ncbi:unnamed protein product [Meloidogyne enterolobii]|uniref:Uncharacterized protein n=1 Tax=Meloidogyne enterolobii TaxID=390850 RepID=A0ACB0ZVY8_MELEN
MSSDLNNSNYTCDELPPSSIIKWPGVHLISIDSIKDAKIGAGIENSVDGVRTVGIILQINEEGVITGINECCSSGKENLRFKLKNVDLVVKRSERYDGKFNNDENIERLVLEVKPFSRLPTSSWKALIQARLYVAEYGGSFRLVMGEVFELSTNSSDPPLELRIDQKIFAIKLEMRYINEYYREMPLFKDGDLEVFATKYDPEPFAWVHRALLALYTPRLVLSDDGTVLNNRIVLKDHDITKEQFNELLYQIYRTGRPISSNLENLSIAATKLDCELILWKLCRFMAGNSDELNFIEKVRKSAKLGLNEAIKQISYNVVKTGEWEMLQNGGFDARECFGQKIYCNYVLPAIVEAINDKNNVNNSFLRACLYEQKHKCPVPGFDSPYEASNPFNASIELDNKKFIYVNIGILQANGCLEKFAGFDGSGMKFGQLKLRPIISSNLKAEMEYNQLRLEQVLSPLLALMYGTGDNVPNNLIRSCLIFACDHGMKKIVKELEEMICNELITGPNILLNHFQFAERYHLKNLERFSLWQLECEEYHKLGLALLELEDYNKLGKNMRYNIEDRLCSGWGVYNKSLAKREKSGIIRFVLNTQSCEPETASVKNDDLCTVVTENEAEFDAYQHELGTEV